jgi:hypothetical protein
MSIMMDYVASAIVFGILMVTIASIQININSTLYENTFSVRVQGNAVALASQLEHDILKAGYRVASGAISVADTSRLTFTSDMNNTGTVVTLAYSTGDSTQLTATTNVHDFPLYRSEAGASVKQNWGLIYFKFSYYDSTMHRLDDVPLDSEDRGLIRAIQASFIVQSPEPVISDADTTWPAVTWEKMLWPRNLGALK